MVKKVEEKPPVTGHISEQVDNKLVVIDEKWFLDKGPSGAHMTSTIEGASYSIRLERDSYVWLFSGRRGAGKSVAMSFFIVAAVILYNMRIISNYAIEFYVRRYHSDGTFHLQHIKSETIDFEKLLMQSEDYKHCLIALDEAPDIISHLASQTWKNRLINAFVRQIRHGFNSLLIAAQDDTLIDKSLRWQIDIELACKDVSRSLGDNSGMEPGEAIDVKWYDHSGQWTGESTKDRLRQGDDPVVDQGTLSPRFLFGDEKHKAVFDSWQDINIMESLFRVDMQLTSVKVGDNNRTFFDKYPVAVSAAKKALDNVDDIFRLHKQGDRAVWVKGFYAAFSGGIAEKDRSNIGKLLSECNIKRGGNKNKPWMNFDEGFDYDKFKSMVSTYLQGKESE